MATNADELSPQEPGEGEEGREEPTNPETNDQQEPGDGEGEDEPPASPTVEELAASMGWRPKDQYNDPDKPWKPAHEFILFTRDLERSRYNELKSLRSQMDVMARTTADIVQDRLQQQREELTNRYNELVEDGNAAEAFKVSQRLVDLDRRATQPVHTPPSPEGQEFAERNSHWLGKDAAATARAVEITNNLAAKGVPAADQLRAAERILRLEYPEYFKGQLNGQQRRDAPAVHRPGSRSPAPSNRQKGFSDMPLEAQKVAEDMAARGVIPDKEAYSARYWQNVEGKR